MRRFAPVEMAGESHGEEMIGECPTCHRKGEVDEEPKMTT